MVGAVVAGKRVAGKSTDKWRGNRSHNWRSKSPDNGGSNRPDKGGSYSSDRRRSNIGGVGVGSISSHRGSIRSIEESWVSLGFSLTLGNVVMGSVGIVVGSVRPDKRDNLVDVVVGIGGN